MGRARMTRFMVQNLYVDRIAGAPALGEANGALRVLQGYSEGRSGIHE